MEQRHNKKKFRFFWQRLRLAAGDTFLEYSMYTKVSGIWLLRPTKAQGVYRVLWSMVLISLFLLAIFLSLQLWIKFYSYPILNTIANDLSITDVPFPGITVCSPKVLNLDRVQRFLETIHIPAEYSLRDIAEGLQHLNAFTDQTFVSINNTLFKMTEEVLVRNNLSIYEAAVAVSPSCDDFVKHCFWGNKEFPCHQNHKFLSFQPTTSYLGPCCSFNYHPLDKTYLPYSANTFGIDGGLSFIGVEGSESDISTGLMVLVHHTLDYVTEAADSVTITSNSESFIEILPTVLKTSNEVLELTPKKRDCLTTDDVPDEFYRQVACVQACESKLILDTCKCNPYFLQETNSPYRECKLNDTSCYADNFEQFKSVRCEECLPNCHDVSYNSVAYKTDLLVHNYSVNHFHTKFDFTPKSFMVHVFLSRQVVPSIHKVATMSWVGLLSDLGGVFSLCLGLSMISVVEFVFYCTNRLKKNFKMRSVILQTVN